MRKTKILIFDKSDLPPRAEEEHLFLDNLKVKDLGLSAREYRKADIIDYKH